MNKYLMKIFLPVGLWMTVASCAPGGQAEGQAPEAAAQPRQELALPTVPALLTTPEERATYVVLHYWDAMDFAAAQRRRDTAFVEQSVVNYLSLLPYAPPEARAASLDTTLRRAARDTAAWTLVADILERYLNDPNSPMRDEEGYCLYLESLLRLQGLSEGERWRAAARLTLARKNRPGTLAADFAYEDRDGRHGRLYGVTARRLLLLFYDPECDHCAAILDDVRRSPVVARRVAEATLTVLAVYTEGDRAVWEATKGSMPAEWTVGIDADSVVARETYAVPAMPVLYLLDEAKRVLLKDATVGDVERALDERDPQAARPDGERAQETGDIVGHCAKRHYLCRAKPQRAAWPV